MAGNHQAERERAASSGLENVEKNSAIAVTSVSSARISDDGDSSAGSIAGASHAALHVGRRVSAP